MSCRGLSLIIRNTGKRGFLTSLSVTGRLNGHRLLAVLKQRVVIFRRLVGRCAEAEGLGRLQYSSFRQYVCVNLSVGRGPRCCPHTQYHRTSAPFCNQQFAERDTVAGALEALSTDDESSMGITSTGDSDTSRRSAVGSGSSVLLAQRSAQVRLPKNRPLLASGSSPKKSSPGSKWRILTNHMNHSNPARQWFVSQKIVPWFR